MKLVLAAVLGGLSVVAAGLAIAAGGAADPLAPTTVVVGAPAGAAPCDRLDPHRTGRSRAKLPEAPVELWRRPLSGGLDLAPLVDGRGDIVAALTVPEIVKLDRDGQERWRTRVGAAGALAPPTLASDGLVVVVTAEARAFGIEPSGAVRFDTRLGVSGRDLTLAPMPTDDGGFVLVAGRALIEVGGDGAVRARAELPDRAAGPPVLHRDGILITTERGTVFSFRAPGRPREVGSFQGTPRGGAALADDRTLVAVIDETRIVDLDLKTGTTHVRSGSTGALSWFDGPVAVDAHGVVLTTTFTGLLLGYDRSGTETARVAIEKQLLAGDAGAGSLMLGSLDPKPSPPVIVDADGRVAFARRGGKVGVATLTGGVHVASERLCSTPIAIVPGGDGRLLVACKDGTLWMLGDR